MPGSICSHLLLPLAFSLVSDGLGRFRFVHDCSPLPASARSTRLMSLPIIVRAEWDLRGVQRTITGLQIGLQTAFSAEGGRVGPEKVSNFRRNLARPA